MQVSAFAVIKIFKRRKKRVLAFIQYVFVKKRAVSAFTSYFFI